MDKQFYLESYNYKYNAWLPCEIIEKWSDNLIKVRCYVFQKKLNENGEEEKYLAQEFETGAFWHQIRSIRNNQHAEKNEG